MATETVQSLVAYCQENRRVCPKPGPWDTLYQMLRPFATEELRPPPPLILAAWHEPALLKILRLKDQIEWADQRGRLAEVADYLRGLTEKEWHHLGE